MEFGSEVIPCVHARHTHHTRTVGRLHTRVYDNRYTCYIPPHAHGCMHAQEQHGAARRLDDYRGLLREVRDFAGIKTRYAFHNPNPNPNPTVRTCGCGVTCGSSEVRVSALDRRPQRWFAVCKGLWHLGLSWATRVVLRQALGLGFRV